LRLALQFRVSAVVKEVVEILERVQKGQDPCRVTRNHLSIINNRYALHSANRIAFTMLLPPPRRPVGIVPLFDGTRACSLVVGCAVFVLLGRLSVGPSFKVFGKQWN
jgi:hypothetical protein